MDHTLLSLVVLDCSLAGVPVNPTRFESVLPRSRHSILVLVERVVKSSVELVLLLGCATKVFPVEAVTIICTWLDVDLWILVVFPWGRDLRFLQLIGVIAAIVVVSTLDSSAT